MAGGVFSGAKLHAMTIRESANDGSDFTNPDADYRRLFLGEDGQLHVKDSAGAVTDIGASSGSVATDAIWDAAGDLAVGTGANTAAKLAIGAVGGVVGRVNGAVAWNGGTAFPGSKATGDRFWRSDLGLEFYWDGSQWVTAQLFRLEMMSNLTALSATGLLTQYVPSWGTAGPFSDLWLVEAIWAVDLDATNTGAAYWTLDIYKTRTAGSGDASVASGTTQSLTASQKHVIRTAIGALAGATAVSYYGFATKVGSPSNLQKSSAALLYRGVST